MKKIMKIIFIIAILFIISVGMFGIYKGNRRQGNNRLYDNLQMSEEKKTKEDKKREEISRSSDTAQNEDVSQDSNTANETSKITKDEKIIDKEQTQKEQYITRLDSIESYYEELWQTSGSLDMTSMKELKNQEYTKWDDELNTIYQLIKKKLPEEKFFVLRDEERQWIKDRDENSELAASQYAGGTMEGLEYMAVMTDLTRERTYDLVKIYFEE